MFLTPEEKSLCVEVSDNPHARPTQVHRAAVLLAADESEHPDRSTAEIAEHVGVDTTTVRTLLNRTQSESVAAVLAGEKATTPLNDTEEWQDELLAQRATGKFSDRELRRRYGIGTRAFDRLIEEQSNSDLGR